MLLRSFPPVFNCLIGFLVVIPVGAMSSATCIDDEIDLPGHFAMLGNVPLSWFHYGASFGFHLVPTQVWVVGLQLPTTSE
jgi:hypothetical protein